MSKQAKKRLVPELRFPKYKGAGEWKEESLDKVYSFLVTNSLSRDKLNYAEGAVKNIHYGDIHTKFSTLFDITKEKVPFINADVDLGRLDSKSYCLPSDIVFADASEDLEGVGKAIEIINVNDERVVAGLHTLHARQLKKKLVPGFGGYLFLSERLRSQIKREAQGAKVVSISVPRLSNTLVFYPESKKEQQDIAACLSSLDALLAAEREKLEALRDHKKGLMQQLFPAEGAKVPKRRFPGFRREWGAEPLGKYTSKVGSGITPRGGDKTYLKEGRIFIRSQNVGWGVLLLDEVAYIDEETHQTFPGTEIQLNDVLLNLSGASIGRSAVADERLVGGNVNQHVCIIRVNEDLHGVYIQQYILSKGGQAQIDSFQAGGNRQGLNYDQVRSFSIPLPADKDEQKEIALCLSSMDKRIALQEERVGILEDHKKGLMQGLFPQAHQVEA